MLTQRLTMCLASEKRKAKVWGHEQMIDGLHSLYAVEKVNECREIMKSPFRPYEAG